MSRREKAKVSFEFFPPRTEKMEETLWRSVDILSDLNPAFVSVTYGAGGSTRERTHDIVTNIQRKKGIAAAAHLTCVGATSDEIDEIAKHYWESGIKHLVALRGDPKGGLDNVYKATPGGYAYAVDLINGLKKIADFEISVAGYPEKHPEAVSLEKDIEYLKAKVDAGATRVITQFFFDNDKFLQYRDLATKAGINVPIVPGILPITNFARSVEFAEKCGASMPEKYHKLFGGLEDNLEAQKLIAATVATEQCLALREEGVNDFHIYTLNRAELALAISRYLEL